MPTSWSMTRVAVPRTCVAWGTGCAPRWRARRVSTCTTRSCSRVTGPGGPLLDRAAPRRDRAAPRRDRAAPRRGRAAPRRGRAAPRAVATDAHRGAPRRTVRGARRVARVRACHRRGVDVTRPLGGRLAARPRGWLVAAAIERSRSAPSLPPPTTTRARWAPRVRWAPPLRSRAWRPHRHHPSSSRRCTARSVRTAPVQALAGSVGLVCCGSGTAASAIGMDKTLFKRICTAIELPVLPWVEIRAQDWARIGRSPSWRSWRRSPQTCPTRDWSSSPHGWVRASASPSSIAPMSRRSSERPSRRRSASTTCCWRSRTWTIPRELEATVVGNGRHDLEVFGPGEVRPGREFYDYVAKYRSDASSSDMSPDLDPDLARGCPTHHRGRSSWPSAASGFARVDFLLSRDDLLFVSEINTIPGFTPISLFPRLCASGGYDFGGICERIVSPRAGACGRSPRRVA